MRQRVLPFVFLLFIVALIFAGVIYTRNRSAQPEAGLAQAPAPTAAPTSQIDPTPLPSVEPSGAPTPTSNPSPDLSADDNGLSRATVLLTTSKGLVKFKFYPKDAPHTVRRIGELITQGFYNNLTWHRVVPGFVVQGGDPQGNGTGGSGQKLAAEFNERRHVEGAVAMARGSDPNSADSQFYIALGTLPHLDRSYTVFGQVIEGMDVVRKLQVGDKIISIVIQ